MIGSIPFDKLWEECAPGQNKEEWFRFLSIIASVLGERGVARPAVVEIGVHTQCQRRYYEELLGIKWFGIDISGQYSEPTIKGDSADPSTRAELIFEVAKWRDDDLSIQPIDILFIDGDHSYEAVKRDYEIYAPLTRHIVAFHDIRSIAGPGRLFEEIIDASTSDRKTTFLRIECWNTHTYRYGIGVIVNGE